MIPRIPLLFLVASLLSACAAPRPPREPRPAGVAPPTIEVQARALLAQLASDGHPATLAEGPDGALVVTFDTAIPMGDGEPFMRAFAAQYGPLVGFQARLAHLEPATQTAERALVDPLVPRDTGCRAVRLTFGRSEAEPRSLRTVTRTCEPLRGRPPAYRSRRLPWTASGSVEVLAHCGAWGNGVVASYGGRALDKFGDIYVFGSTGPEAPAVEPRMFVEYVGTVPPEEVEQLLDDTAEASRASERAHVPAPGAVRCESTFDTGKGLRSLDIETRKGDAASRARTWLHGVLEPHE